MNMLSSALKIIINHEFVRLYCEANAFRLGRFHPFIGHEGP